MTWSRVHCMWFSRLVAVALPHQTPVGSQRDLIQAGEGPGGAPSNWAEGSKSEDRP